MFSRRTGAPWVPLRSFTVVHRDDITPDGAVLGGRNGTGYAVIREPQPNGTRLLLGRKGVLIEAYVHVTKNGMVGECPEGVGRVISHRDPRFHLI